MGACANAQICKGNRCSHIQSMGIDDDSGQISRSLSSIRNVGIGVKIEAFAQMR